MCYFSDQIPFLAKVKKNILTLKKLNFELFYNNLYCSCCKYMQSQSYFLPIIMWNMNNSNHNNYEAEIIKKCFFASRSQL